jgi:three-Cys-motif partner protein
MGNSDFYGKAYDEGTLTKLEIFQLYTREWLPVFISQKPAPGFGVHLFDFFAGPGCDAAGVPGSPLRTLQVIQEFADKGMPGCNRTVLKAHFFDASKTNIAALQERIGSRRLASEAVTVDSQPLEFAEAFERFGPTLRSRDGAKLLLIDQFGVDTVTEAVFRQLVEFPRTDFLFFISSNTLRRFREHPAIKQKITHVDDHYQVHRAVVASYRQLLPKGRRYYLAPFSIKKGANIYGLIFGSAHPLGMDKFLTVAWKKDRLNGEADYDILRDNLDPAEGMLPLGDIFRPTKVTAFERALRNKLMGRLLRDETDVMEVCFAHGVTRQHAKPVLQALKEERLIDIDFQVPSLDRLRNPKPIGYP